MVEYIIGGTVIKALYDGQFATTCIKNMSTSIYGLLEYIISNPDNILLNTLASLDIEFEVRIMESLISDIKTDEISSVTFNLCLTALKDCVAKIEKELQTIHKKMQYNNSIYLFKSWRSYPFTNNVNILHTYSNILKKRSKMLFSILKISPDLISKKSMIIRESLILKN